MHTRKRLGVPPALFSRPYSDGFQKEEMFETLIDAPAALAKRLETRQLDAALLSPIDYARNGSEYLIVPGTAVSSPSANDSLVLHFRKGATAIRTLAVPQVSASDIILAKILLAEKFDQRPQIVPVAGTLGTMLAKADAALVTDDPALFNGDSYPPGLDLVEEWVTTTDLPYVHGIWCGRENALSEDEWRKIASSGEEGFDAIMQSGSPDAKRVELFSFGFPASVQEGIREFLRYAYYHGILPDVPDLRMYSADAGTPAEPSLLN